MRDLASGNEVEELWRMISNVYIEPSNANMLAHTHKLKHTRAPTHMPEMHLHEHPTQRHA